MRIEKVLQIEIPEEVETAAIKIWEAHKDEFERLLEDKDMDVEKKIYGLLEKILPSDEFRALPKSNPPLIISGTLALIMIATTCYAIGQIAT